MSKSEKEDPETSPEVTVSVAEPQPSTEGAEAAEAVKDLKASGEEDPTEDQQAALARRAEVLAQQLHIQQLQKANVSLCSPLPFRCVRTNLLSSLRC